MIIIKKYIKYLGLLILCLASFYYTEKVALYVKSKNPLMQTLKDIKETNYVSSINSTIIDDLYIIPGLNGQEINLDKSFTNLHKHNIYDESNLVWNEIKPSISIEDNKDKIIIRGNKEKNSVSLIFENITKLSEYLIQNNYKVNLLINEEPKNNKYELINNSNTKTTYQAIEKYLNKNDNNNNLCYIKDETNIPDYCQDKYLFKSSMIISHTTISTLNNKISSGEIILIKDSLTLSELNVLLNQIKYKNLSIVPLSELISENNK